MPIIAAVNGPAVGGGFALALACDIRVCGPSTYFHPNFLDLAISSADLGTSWALPRAIGSSRAFEILLTGRAVGAEESERIGLVCSVDDNPLRLARSMAAEIASRSPLAIRLTREAVWASLETPSQYTAMELENRTQVLATMAPDHVEATDRFHRRKAERH